MKIAATFITAQLLLAGTAMAQDAPAQPAPAQPPAEATAPAAPAAPADPAAPVGEVNEDEVARFALAALVINQIAADETLPQEQQQTAMAQVIQQTGLEPQRFNQIASASQTDTALQQRIETAAKGHIAAAQQEQPQAGQPQG